MLEDALRRLNADYDAFLYGSSAKPPIQNRKAVEEMFRRLNALDSLPAAERYRFTTLQGRYAILIERWDRLQGEKAHRPMRPTVDVVVVMGVTVEAL